MEWWMLAFMLTDVSFTFFFCYAYSSFWLYVIIQFHFVSKAVFLLFFFTYTNDCTALLSLCVFYVLFVSYLCIFTRQFHLGWFRFVYYKICILSRSFSSALKQMDGENVGRTLGDSIIIYLVKKQYFCFF